MPATATTHPDLARLDQLRALADSDPAAGRRAAWEWLTSLDATRELDRLETIFHAGLPPEDGPIGEGEGKALGIMGTPFLTFVDRLERLGQRLGGIGWNGKTFNADGTGHNRLTTSSRIPMFFVMPRYEFRRRDGQLNGFDFDHSISPSPREPHPLVRGITYDRPEYRNPIMLPRTRDELVEIVPDVYLGRALLHDEGDDSWEIVAYFVQRHPVGG